MGTPSGWGRVEASLEHAEICCQCVCCSFRAAFFLFFPRKYFSLLFFSTSLFLVVNDKEEKEMWSCALRSAPFYPPPGNGGVMAILVLLTLQGQVIQLLDKAISVSALFQPHFPFSARISSDVKGMGLLPVFCSERDLFHMVNLTTAVWDFSPPTKHP